MSSEEFEPVLLDREDLPAPASDLYDSVILDYDDETRGGFGNTLMERATHILQTEGKAPAVSQRFVDCAKGDLKEAKRRWESTLKWRIQNRVNEMCRREQKHFRLIKKFYPQFYHFRSREGYMVYYEKLGQIDLKAMMAEGLTFEDIMSHYLFISEFLYTYLCPDEISKTITILDCAHLSMMKMPSEVKKFILTANNLLGQHYPEKAAHIYIINVPMLFKVLFNIVSPFLDPVTLKKVHILRGKKNITKALLKHIDPENLPVEYGGTCKVALGESPEELLLNELVEALKGREDRPTDDLESGLNETPAKDGQGNSILSDEVASEQENENGDPITKSEETPKRISLSRLSLKSLKRESLKRESLKRESLKRESLKHDSFVEE